MKQETYEMTEKLYLWSGETTAWHFLPITKSVGEKIKATNKLRARGFGSLRVSVTIGETTWQTSIFPDSHSGSYLLPVKASVRKREGLYADDTVLFSITLI